MRERLAELLEAVAAGSLSPGAALERLRHFPEEDIGLAKVDHHRGLRLGHPEVVLASHKTVVQLIAITERLAAASGSFLCTRVTGEQAEALASRFPGVRLHPEARTAWLPPDTAGPTLGTVAVVTAGTSDIPVAEEAAVVAEAFGAAVIRVFDAGVAGLHRILSARPDIERADVVIVVAGMEGALPSVVGGLVGRPVIAVRPVWGTGRHSTDWPPSLGCSTPARKG